MRLATNILACMAVILAVTDNLPYATFTVLLAIYYRLDMAKERR